MLTAGTFTDAGLRTHELFAPDHRVPRRRQRRFLAASVAAAILLVGAGVGARIQAEGQDRFVAGMQAKYRAAAAQGKSYVQALVSKVKF